MDWFAMSSRFYTDLDDQGISEAAQTLLCRACGYMALNETGGFLAKSALKKLGLSRVSRRIHELLSSRIAVERADGSGYDFPAWHKWNAALERQVRKRKADRERIAEKRARDENVARQSREFHAMSRDHSNSNNTKNSGNGSSSATGSNAREREEPPRGPSVGIDGWKIIRDVVPPEHPQATKTALALEASAMLTAGTTDADVRAGLDLWLSKPNLGPRTLPSLVSEVIRSRDRPPIAANGNGRIPTTTARVAAVQALKRPEWGDDPKAIE